jgi:hypothetical protein
MNEVIQQLALILLNTAFDIATKRSNSLTNGRCETTEAK